MMDDSERPVIPTHLKPIVGDAYNTGRSKGHVAGLKEALEVIQREVVEWGVVGDGIGDLIAEAATKTIRARIEELSLRQTKDNGNG